MFIKITSIYDFISLFALMVNIYFFHKFNPILLLGFILCIFFQYVIKFITTGWYPPIFKRPDGAINCNLFNTGGLVEDKSGFPSGHVAVVAFLMEFLLLQNKNKNKGLYNFIYYNIPTFLVAFARVQKGCHNVIQVIAGYILGYGIANVLYTYEKNIKEYLKKEFPFLYTFKHF